MSILLVDDEANILATLSETLVASGFDVRTCKSGQEALSCLTAHRPEVMVTDLRMPDLNGLDLLKQVREQHPDLPVVILTGFGDMKSAVDALRLGAFDYLQKPIDAERLVQTLKNGLERHRLIQENRDLIARLTEANRFKIEFLHSMSHEIRTPLGHITGFSELLEQTLEGLTDKQVRYLHNIQNAARKLLTLFDDTLRYIDLNNQKTTLNLAPLTIAEVFFRQQAAFAEALRMRNLTLDIHPIETVVMADAFICEKVLEILLKNAVQFCPADSRIVLKADLKPEPDVADARRDALLQGAANAYLHLSVTDEGPGIAPKHQARIFDLFVQGDGSLSREHGGTGLGLALGSSLARLHGGIIDLQSAPGTGSTFTLVIPVSTDA